MTIKQLVAGVLDLVKRVRALEAEVAALKINQQEEGK